MKRVIGQECSIFLGDCLKLLPVVAKGDGVRTHVFADPPYEDELHKAAKRGKIKSMNVIDFDGVNALRAEFAQAMVEASTGWLLAFSLAEGVRAWRDPIQAAGGKWDTTLAWVKPDSTPRMNGQGAARGFECIVSAWCGSGHRSWNAGGKRGLYTHLCNWPDRQSAKDGGHPTEKPLGLMMELIRDFTQPGDLVVDPFMGSGTTGVACLRLGRRFIGIEQDRKWFELAGERLKHELAQPQLFAPEPRLRNIPLPLEAG